jgi:hypothetical protein
MSHVDSNWILMSERRKYRTTGNTPARETASKGHIRIYLSRSRPFRERGVVFKPGKTIAVRKNDADRTDTSSIRVRFQT